MCERETKFTAFVVSHYTLRDTTLNTIVYIHHYKYIAVRLASPLRCPLMNNSVQSMRATRQY